MQAGMSGSAHGINTKTTKLQYKSKIYVRTPSTTKYLATVDIAHIS